VEKLACNAAPANSPCVQAAIERFSSWLWLDPSLAACARLPLPCPSELHYFPLQIFIVASGEWPLVDFYYQCREVSETSYRLRQTAIEPGNIFSDGSHQQCTLYRLQWDSAALEVLSKLRISRTEAPDRAADGDKAFFHYLDITIAVRWLTR
jgi:hypothetical protein